MKTLTPEERAREIMSATYKVDSLKSDLEATIVRHIKEAMRDQRHVCAEVACDARPSELYSRVFNADVQRDGWKEGRHTAIEEEKL